MIDHKWVVPYNPHLTAKYNTHINVEIYSTVTSVKYLYKYVYKGPDRIVARLESSTSTDIIDEIKRFVDARYVSAAKAC